MEIVINLDDWKEWQKRKDLTNVGIETEEDLLRVAVAFDLTISELSRLYIILREENKTDPDILGSNKVMFARGAMALMSVAISRMRKPVKIGKKTYRVREAIMPVSEDDGGNQAEEEDAPDEVKGKGKKEQTTIKSEASGSGKVPTSPPSPPHIVLLGSEEANNRAYQYLMVRVTGYVAGRLLVIRESGGDVRAVGDEFIAVIEEMVKELEPPSQ